MLAFGNVLSHQFLTPPVANMYICLSVRMVSPKAGAVGRVFVQTKINQKTDGSVNTFAYNLMWSYSMFLLSCAPKRGDSLEDRIEPVRHHVPLLTLLKLHKGWEMRHSGTRVTGSLKGDEKEALSWHGMGFWIFFLLRSLLKWDPF